MTLKRLTDSGTLVDVTPLERPVYVTGRELVPTDSATCPECGGFLFQNSLWQDSLVRHGGYGGTQRVDSEWCYCGFERVVAVATERPPR